LSDKIGDNEAYCKKQPRHHEGERNLFFHFSCFLRGIIKHTFRCL
jgi:hypothetical protein